MNSDEDTNNAKWKTALLIAVFFFIGMAIGTYTGAPPIPTGVDYDAGYDDGYHEGWHDGAGWKGALCDPWTITGTLCIALPIALAVALVTSSVTVLTVMIKARKEKQ